MTVETATYPSQLNVALPDSGDPESEGAAHLRLLKSTIKNLTPNFTAAALNATQAQIDALAVGTGSVSSTPNSMQAAGFLIGGVHVGAPTGVDAFSVAGTTVLTSAHGYLLATPGSGTIVFNLPNPVGIKGRTYAYKKFGSNGAVYFQCVLGGTVDGTSVAGHTAEGGMRAVVSDGANWHTISQYLAGV